MTQRWSHALRQTVAAITSVSVLASGAPAGAQGLGDVGAYSGKADAGLTSTLNGATGAAGALGRLDTTLATPVIRSDDKARFGDKERQPHQEAHAPAPPKPLPLNDFQKFVKESTGQALPLFGADFFTQPQGGFEAQANTPVSPDYRLGPGDEVQIKGWGSVDIDVRAEVDRNGLIHIPRVGSVALAGVRSSQAEATVRAAVGRYYKDFQLSVTQGQLRGITIYVVGQARQPGAYNLSGASTLVSALFASGGPNQLGSMRHVQVKRGDRVVTELDLYDFLAKGDKSADVRLQDGDTIVIPSAKAYVALTGTVATPAVYELASEQDTIGGILALAGGLPVVADPKRAYLERVDPTQKPARSVESFALDANGLRKKLRSGDLLSVMSLSPEFGNAITLRGNVDQPVRTPWKQGMKVRDLIPSKSFLMSRASVQRQNNVLHKADDTEDSLASRIGKLVDEINLEYAVVERVDSNNVSVQLLPFNLGAALDDANSPENLPLMPGDIVTVFSVNDVRVPQAKRQVFVRVEGEVKRPGIYQMSPGDGLPQLIDKAGGLTPDAYLFGAGFYREEVRQAQLRNLDQLVRRMEGQMQTQLSSAAASVSSVSPDSGTVAQLRIQAEARAQQQALDRLRNLKPTGRIMLSLQPDAKPDALPALKLESQDRLVIPSRPDFVYVLGSVNTEASLLWRPGRSVKHYLEQSGLTSGADRDEMFIMRADGSVLSDDGSWGSGLMGATVQPGDLIVLPEKTDHESKWSAFTRNAKDITQIIYQFSLGAAAIKTLRD
ncbi:MAG TPA: SLBB domain-containing protein [Aquabacterium sp.]|uniref:SLBB domain-containing protein n=1 Tax=Aquabacterium sp. TaxID=1872578 RepID=UPI002E334739|nr:SLBB domain-containing protein [Aquabacterium sp.]HEX5373120.1 SLBB domain-containing protein [Aquabacterium sp.]